MITLPIEMPPSPRQQVAETTISPPRQKSRWSTAEFLVYTVYLALCYVLSVPAVMRMGEQVFPEIIHHLSLDQTPLSGLFGDRMIDNSDAQYAGFRNNLPMLFAAMIGYLTISWTVRQISKQSTAAWRGFLLLFSLVFIAVLHGPSGLIKILSLLSISYFIGQETVKSFSRPWTLLFTWMFCIGILFANDLYSGLSYRHLFPPLGFLDQDRYKGLLPRWYITFNITILRLISFNTDLFWSRHPPLNQRSSSSTSGVSSNRGSKQDEDPAKKRLDQRISVDQPNDRQRVQQSRPVSEYNFVNYLIYCLYAPLFLAGPIITFNDFMSQIMRPKRDYGWTQVWLYGLRLAGAILLMETMMRLLWVVAMSKSQVWDSLTPIQLALFSYYNLKFIWLKLLIIWRFFRFWSLADGIDPPENMVRCMSNNYSAVGFWRDWHRSYNRWLVRYLYIPLGGKHYQVYNIWVIFTFVALWHDIQLRLLIWSWLICLFILPEIFCTLLYKRVLYRLPFARHLAAFGATLNIMMMILANLVGFCLGFDGAVAVFSRILTLQSIGSMLVIFFAVYSAAQIMMELRRSESQETQKD